MRDSEQTKSRILAAALDEFADKGFAGTRVDEIGRRAGVNKAMIYYYFSSKEELFNELFRLEMEQLKQELGAVLNHTLTTPEDATRVTREFLTYIETKEKYLRVLMSSSLLSKDLQLHFFQLLDLTTATGIEVAQKEGLPEPGSMQDALLNELFTGLLPLIGFVLLRDGLLARYGWDRPGLTERFIAGWLRQHGAY